MVGPRQEMRHQLLALAARQSGYFTAAQARDVGYAYAAQKFHADHGNWLRIDRGLFRLPEWPMDEHDSLVRWALWARGKAVVSHETALAAHRLGDVNPALVDLTATAIRDALDAGVVTRAQVLRRADSAGEHAELRTIRALQLAGETD